MKTWQIFNADEREYQYNPQRSVEGYSSFQIHRTEVARVCRKTFQAELDVAYGPGPLHKVDIFPAGANAPVHMFFHGGYWRAQDKENFAFLARDLVPQGVTLVTVNYDLCPAVTLDGVTASALTAIEWCYKNIATHGGNPDALTISGNSAGAHLCSMAIATDWTSRAMPTDAIKGAVMLSGIFDPEPASHISVQAELKLDAETIRRNDALTLTPRVSCPIWLFAGGQEPWAWIDQTFDYSRHLRQNGYDPEVQVLPRYHHFNIMDEYLMPQSPIARAVHKAAVNAGATGNGI